MTDREPRNDGEMLEELRETAVDTAVQQLRMIHALKQQAAARSPSGTQPHDAAPSPQASSGGAAHGTGASEFLFDLARLSLSNYRGWLRVTSTHFDFLADALSKLSAKPTEAPPAQPRLDLSADATPGKEVKVGFILDNPDAVDAEVRFTPLAFATPDGVELKGSAKVVRVTADGRAIEQGSRIVLTPREAARLCVVVDPGRSEPGAYRADSVVVLGARVVGKLVVSLNVVSE